MTRFERILCPVDLSEASRRALATANALATWYDATLTVLEVSWAGLPPLPYPAAISGWTPAVLRDDERTELLADLRAFAAGVAPAGPRIRTVLREGPIVPQVLAEAEALHADLMVLGTHGRSGFDRLLLGSVTEKLLRKARCPVLTVPPGADSAAAAPPEFRTIACAIDFSPASMRGLDHALSLAQEAGARLLLVHAFDWPASHMVSSKAGRDLDTVRAAILDDVTSRLKAAVPEEARNWCTAEEVVRDGRAHEEIVALARERGADLIVIGLHGRTSVDLAFFGSTTNQVVREAPCPVLTVRP